jgi:hypothetical protein
LLNRVDKLLRFFCHVVLFAKDVLVTNTTWLSLAIQGPRDLLINHLQVTVEGFRQRIEELLDRRQH